MIYKYKALTPTGEISQGEVEAINVDVAIAQLQKRGLVISEIHGAEDKGMKIPAFAFFNGVSVKDVVILSRQMATLFQSQVSALRIFRLIGSQVDNAELQKQLTQIADDIQGGSPISTALARHPDTFSAFYVNMVRAGEESGKLDETFNYLADYLDRTYEVTSKAKNALIYPAFVIATFIGVMVIMLTVIIPKIALMLTSSGQEIPIYTRIVLGISNIFVNYGIFLAIAVVILGFMYWKYSKTETGAINLDKIRLDIPYLGDLYRKLYLSRIADNLNTMIISGIPILRALEITSAVVENRIYKAILDRTLTEVKGGSSLSASFGQYKEIPGIMVQMIKVGEETGEVGNILKTLAKFYQREVTTSVDTLVGLIEPVMIVALGAGVGILLAAVLMPIYNIASAG
ncbi:MAG: type II secretion system F family protein [Patescibacteria group bacterium]